MPPGTYKNIDGDNFTDDGYDNLLSRENSNSLNKEASGDQTNLYDFSMGINPFNSSELIEPLSIDLYQTTLSPYQEIFLPAESMNPTTTAGCSDLTKVETTTNKINYIFCSKFLTTWYDI
jgi:hypothetical protein